MRPIQIIVYNMSLPSNRSLENCSFYFSDAKLVPHLINGSDRMENMGCGAFFAK